MTSPPDFSNEWRSRCERFRAINRRWMLAAVGWLAVVEQIEVCESCFAKLG